MTNKEAIAELKAMPIIYPITNGENDRASRLMQARDMAIKALKQESCEDAIGRSDMLDAIGHGTTYTSEELQKIIKALPPVNPQNCDKCEVGNHIYEHFEESEPQERSDKE
ncbi:MAG: hypothetical protein IIZ78_26270 [Clostridiales bacterium]|nr:hypothetical protein [Clostridiales bacterium]